MYDPWQRNCPVKKSCKQNLCFQGTTELCGDEYEKSARWVICSLIVNKVFLILKWIQFIMTFWGYLSKSKTRIILYFKLQAGVAYNDVFQSAFYLLGISPLNGQFQKISIPNHGRLPCFNPPLPSEIPKCVTPPCPQNSIIVNPPPLQNFHFF